MSISEWAEGTASGYREQACEVDLECGGHLRGQCRTSVGVPVEAARCPHGWLCRDDEERPSVLLIVEFKDAKARPLRRLTGECEQGGQCRYPCRTGESCEHGRCIRPNGTCLTDYHCRSNQFCHAGRCVMDGLTPCQGVERECSEGSAVLTLVAAPALCSSMRS